MMRKMRENTKFIMLITALAFVALMVFEWGMDASGRGSGGVGEIGSVGRTSVMYDEYQTTYRGLYDQVSRSQDEPISTVQNREIEDAAFEQVVQRILIEQELRRRGIRVTDDEIRQAVRFSPLPEFRNNPAFMTEGEFDLQKYQAFLTSPAADVGLLLELESIYRDFISEQKLLRQIGSGIFVSDAQLWDDFVYRNEMVEVSYVALDPIQRISDSEVELTDREVDRYYRDNQEDYALPARARVRLAVLEKTPTAADTAAILQRAEDLRAEIQGGVEFSEVAARESVDPGSAADGGSLGTFGRGAMVPAFEEVVFSIPVGTISDPVLTPFGVHVIQVEQRWADSAQARHILLPLERTDDSEFELLAQADSLEGLTTTRTLDEATRILGTAPPQEVEITQDFPFVPAAGELNEGADWIFEDVPELNEVSPVFESEQAFYAMELLSSSPAGYLSLEDAREGIRQTLLAEKKLEMARTTGQALVEAARQSGGLEQAAQAQGLQVQQAGPFARSSFVPGLGRHNAAIGAAFALTEGQVSPVVVTESNAYAIQLNRHIPAERSQWEAQLDGQRQAMLADLRSERLEQWLDGLRSQAEVADRRAEVFRQAEEMAEQGPQIPMVF
ncbi:MAG: peptidylprolyl isomerase [Gemmatimonadota bacterium]